MHFLIISAYFWPEDTGPAPYVTGPAEYLLDEGHQVSVIAGHAHYPSWRPTGRRRVLRERHNGLSIHRRPHYIPRSQSAARRGLYELSLIAGGLTALPAVGQPDAILGVTPTLSGAVLARVASRSLRAPYGLLVHDLMGPAAKQSGISGGGRVTRAVQYTELWGAKRARAIGVIAEGFRAYFENAGIPGSRIHRLRTWTLGDSQPTLTPKAVRERFGWSEEEFICLHGGNMGHKQHLDNLIDAAEACDGMPIRIVLSGDGNERRRLQQRAKRERALRVSFLPPQPWGRYEAMLAAADVLLVNQRPSVGDMSLPSKLTSYFAAGRPVVAAVASESETAREVRQAEAGIVVPPGDPQAIVEALRTLTNEPTLRRELGVNGQRYAEQNLSSNAVLRDYRDFAEDIAAGGRYK